MNHTLISIHPVTYAGAIINPVLIAINTSIRSLLNIEDYQGPKNAGYFQWMKDEDGMMRPVTRMKNQNVERNPTFWDKAFKDDDK